IDFVNGQYEVQARQYDGLTGQASPVVNRDRTPDRQFVARTAALLIGRDLGAVGTITDKGDEKKVKVTLKGSGLGVPLERLIKKDEVLTLVRIEQAGSGLRAVRVPFALLQVSDEPKDGVCTCKLFNRHPDPLKEGAGVLGFRCLKIHTTQAPLRLRL